MSMSENKAVEKTVKEPKKGRKQKGLVSVTGQKGLVSVTGQKGLVSVTGIIVDKATTRNI